MRPVIGITTRQRLVRSSEGQSEAHTIQRTYTDAVLRAGAVPVLLAPVPDQHVAALLGRVDGIVLSGGGDVDPARYGGTPNEFIYGVDFDRDEFEIQIALEARSRNLPTLAICRGLQVVNVALGGTLIEDIPTQVGSADHSAIGHKVFDGHQHVTLKPDSVIARAVGTTDVWVNSIHHQAIRCPAPGLHPVGWADDGVIEAVEYEDPAWPLLAVQWHPEYLGDADDPASRALFGSLVESSSRARSASQTPDTVRLP